MKNSKNIHTISSTLKTIASENLVSEDELNNTENKSLEALLNDQKETNSEKSEK